MRLKLTVVLCFLLSICSLAQERAPLSRIGFGSCAHQDKPQRIWNAVYAQRPELFIFLGDNVYGDTYDMANLASKYRKLRQHADFQLMNGVPLIGTWDDHDYGLNDAGRDNPVKEDSKRLILEFFKEPKDSPRWNRPGIYTSYVWGPEGKRVQIILLDTRWNRSPVFRLPKPEAKELNSRTGKGPYYPSPDPKAEVLGAQQWSWLEAELRRPAEIRILASSIPVIHEGTGWETWDNFPKEREKLYSVLRKTEAKGVLLITGDSHRAEFSRLDGVLDYPLWELNASGLTENARSRPPNRNRLGKLYAEDNFGWIQIDWKRKDPQVTLEVRDADNDLVMQNTLRLSELGFRP